MNSIKNEIILILYIIRKRIVRIESIICIVLSGITILKASVSYLLYSNGHTVNIFEGYVQAMSGEENLMIIIICAILLFADAPFINDNSFLIVYRLKRKKWYALNWIYMVVVTMLYMVYLIVLSLIPFIFKGYLDNRWSQSMLRIMNGYNEKMMHYNINPIDGIYRNMSPIGVTFYTAILCAGYILILVSVLYILNMIYTYKPLGTLVVGGIHLISTLINMLGILTPQLIQRFSLYRSAFFLLGYDANLSSGLFSILYFSLLIYIIYLVGLLLLPKADIYLS